MTHLERALTQLNEMEALATADSPVHRISARSKLLVTLLYLVTVLSFSLHALAGILLFALYPIVGSAMSGISYSRILVKSLYVLPLIAIIGLFNPLLHTEPLLSGPFVLSAGWVEFISITLRGVLAVQAVVLLISTTGFHRVCRAMQGLGLPSFLAAQILFVYRYISVLAEEALSMDRARRSRSYGRRHYSLREWGTFAGQLLQRSIARARRINMAMEARLFDGTLPQTHTDRWHWSDSLYLLIWAVLFAAGRLIDPSTLFTHIIH